MNRLVNQRPLVPKNPVTSRLCRSVSSASHMSKSVSSHSSTSMLAPDCLFPALPHSFPLGQALDRLVAVSSIYYYTSTSALSTSSSSRGLTSLRMGYLISGGASRLDAFSVYPFRTWLPGHSLGRLTGTPAVRPSRSSRTKDSSPQISYAHAG